MYIQKHERIIALAAGDSPVDLTDAPENSSIVRIKVSSDLDLVPRLKTLVVLIGCSNAQEVGIWARKYLAAAGRLEGILGDAEALRAIHSDPETSNWLRSPTGPPIGIVDASDGKVSIQREITTMCNSRRFIGKNIVLLGATQGIGLAMAQRLAIEGGTVFVASRREENVEESVQKILDVAGPSSVLGSVCDAKKPISRLRFLDFIREKVDAIDVIICAVAASRLDTLTRNAKGDLADSMNFHKKFSAILETNVISMAAFIREAIGKSILRKEGGSALLVGSIMGYQTTPSMVPLYNISKTALLGLTKALASELAPTRWRVNCIAPGFIPTHFSQALIDSMGGLEKMKKLIPLGRNGTPFDVAAATAFLCSHDASFISGEVLAVTGGLHSRL